MQREVEIGSIVTFGTYEQNGDFDGKKEPIEWIVLDKDDNGVFLLSKKILDCYEFDSTIDYDDTRESGDSFIQTHWDNSSIRERLNNDFYNIAFNDEEKQLIRETETVPYIKVINYDGDDDMYENTLEDDYEDRLNELMELRKLQGQPTTDKVIILSTKELEYYKVMDLDDEPEPTKYAIKCGVWANPDILTNKMRGSYWTRTLASNNYVFCVDSYSDDQSVIVNDDSTGVRPAIWVNFD